MPIQLSEWELKTVKAILSWHLHNAECYVFGSRAKGTAKKHSDLDILIKGKELIELRTFAYLKEEFSDSNLVFIVDLVDKANISEEFYHIIEKDFIPLINLSS